MKAVKHISVFIVALFLLAGCFGKDINARPDWIMNPSKGSKYGGVGVAGIHISGISAQRSLAVSRAIDQIAAQMGTSVNSQLMTEMKGSSAGYTSGMQSVSFQTVDGKTVTARIVEFWEDRNSKEIYVWMQAE